VQFGCFAVLGCGFYMIHGSLQTFASEISIEARGTAVAMHAFCFFLGQTVGPIAYGFGLAHAGKVVTLSGAAIVMLLLGIVCARLLAHRPGS
jgi:MFS transporter, DHA1 family, inner membrane transport protein